MSVAGLHAQSYRKAAADPDKSGGRCSPGCRLCSRGCRPGMPGSGKPEIRGSHNSSACGHSYAWGPVRESLNT